MEFLKAILGEDLFGQFEKAVNAYNENPENKEKQVKLANLGSGEYVSRGKHSALEAENQSNASKLLEAENLIAELKKSNKGNEALQQRVTDYEGRMAQLQAELEQTKLDAAIKVELLSSKALDVDYLTFKLKEKGELALDENGKIKGWDDKLAGLKTQFPTQFESAGSKKYEEHKLPDNQDGGDSISKESFAKMGYTDRLKLFNENPEAYKELTKN